MKSLLIKICLFNLLLGFLLDACAQDLIMPIDSLKNVLLMQKEDTNKVNTLIALYRSSYFKGELKNTSLYANQALSLSKKLNFKRGEASAYEGLAAGNELNLPEFLKNTYAALDAYKEAGDKFGIAQSIRSIGLVYAAQGNNIEALKNFNIALKIYDSLKAEVQIAQCYANIGGIYLKQGKYSDASKMYFAALKIFQQSGMPEWGLTVSYASIGNAYQSQGDSCLLAGNQQYAKLLYSKALSNLLLSLTGYQKMGMTGSVASLYTSLADVSVRLKNISVAKQYLQNSRRLSEGSDDKQLLFDLYKSWSTLDSIQGNYKQAYEHYKLQMLYQDSLSNEESRKKFVQTEMQYEFDKKEAATKAEQAKKDEEAKRIKNQQYFIITSLGIIVLAAIVIAFIQYRNNKHKQKANLVLENTLANLKFTQSQLIQSEKLASLGELTAGIAHEIQNPLNFVNNFSEVNSELIDELEEEADNGNLEEIKSIAKDIKENEQKINHHGKRADAIVKNMLQHSRSSSSQGEPTNINALADEYLRLSYHGFRAKDKSFNATIKTDFDDTIDKINIIPQDIGRVLLNLYNNAFYAVVEKMKQQNGNLPTGWVVYEPTVSVSTKKINDKVEIKVKDNGNGIPQNIVDKIFQPFFTTKPTGEGTGLGLSLSYDIVKAHGGEIKAETGEQEGSKFVVNLPIS